MNHNRKAPLSRIGCFVDFGSSAFFSAMTTADLAAAIDTLGLSDEDDAGLQPTPTLIITHKVSSDQSNARMNSHEPICVVGA